VWLYLPMPNPGVGCGAAVAELLIAKAFADLLKRPAPLPLPTSSEDITYQGEVFAQLGETRCQPIRPDTSSIGETAGTPLGGAESAAG